MPPGFRWMVAAQFVSALADNALLIVTVALLQAQGLPPWWAPMLKFGFTVSYVVLAPFVGPLADAFPKARLMGWMNAVKLAGVAALLLGLHPLAAYALVGFGAAAYAPAKYGLVTEIVPPPRLVAANGWLEVTVVGAALLGTLLGGVLVSPWLLGSAAGAAAHAALAGAGLPAGGALAASLLLLTALYGGAGLLNLGVPHSGARYPASAVHPVTLARDFRAANCTLWRDPEGGLSMAVTTLFWGVGATLQFVVLRWADEALGLSLDRAAYLQGAVAIGVVVGASLAGRCIPLTAAVRVLPAGIALGLMMPVAALITSVPVAVVLLVLVGAVGGVLVVPLNALLQHRGCQLLTAGRSVAVQGFNENASILVMLAVYALCMALETPITVVMWGFGLAIAAAIGLLMWRQRWRRHAGRGAAGMVRG